MTPKASLNRRTAGSSRATSRTKHAESHNGCSISKPNPFQRLAGQEWTPAEVALIATRFWAKVDKSESADSGCWLWRGSVTGGSSVRHGQVVLLRRSRRQRHTYAHRLVWELAYGPIPDGLQVNHKCDVPICVRPEHLYLGTQADNLADARSRGRLNLHRPRTKKLTQAERLAIYHMPDRRGLVTELAIRYRVSKTTISQIRAGRFFGSPFHRVFELVPHVNLPVRGEVA